MASLKSELSQMPDLIDDAANNGHWLITMCHGIVQKNSSNDITPENAETLFKQMAEYQNEGKLWVATFGTATKYIRERQNSEVKAYKNKTGTYVNVKMSDTTKDNLPLTADVFNHPLTVKVNVGNGILSMSYLLEGEKQYADCFIEEGKNYVYVNVIPNSEDVLLTIESGEEIPDMEPDEPTEPTAPNEPNGATEPSEPAAPDEPTEPGQTTAPSEPTAPDEPAVSDEPTEPEESIESSESAGSEDFTETSEPIEAGESIDPDDTSESESISESDEIVHVENAPSTGDGFNIATYALALVALSGIVLLLIKFKPHGINE